MTNRIDLLVPPLWLAKRTLRTLDRRRHERAASAPPSLEDTVELLRPVSDEPDAQRAQRQARAYLDLRRRRLADDLAARGMPRAR